MLKTLKRNRALDGRSSHKPNTEVILCTGVDAIVDITADAALLVCSCTVNTTRAGSYTLRITQGGELVECGPSPSPCLNPLQIHVTAGQANLDNSYFLVPKGLRVLAGSSLAVAVFSQDYLGNAVPLGSIDVLVNASEGQSTLCNIAEVNKGDSTLAFAVCPVFLTAFTVCISIETDPAFI